MFAAVQLTDPHLGAPWSDDPAAALGTAIAQVARVLDATPDAVIVSGDVANTPTDSEYEQARALVDRFGAPVYVAAGNHDDRDGLRRHFELPRTPGAELYYAVDLGPARLIVLDTKREGGDGGQLAAEQLDWLERVLCEDHLKPTMIAMHHPPLMTGIPAMDRIGIPSEDRAALGEVVSRHPQVQVIAAGHVHRAVIGRLGGAAVVAIPSTDVQLALELTASELRFVREPPSFALHLLVDDRFVSHIQPVDPRAV
jgi:3',5'-cyclic AMP phosphodiesterase CpdA